MRNEDSIIPWVELRSCPRYIDVQRKNFVFRNEDVASDCEDEDSDNDDNGDDEDEEGSDGHCVMKRHNKFNTHSILNMPASLLL